MYSLNTRNICGRVYSTRTQGVGMGFLILKDVFGNLIQCVTSDENNVSKFGDLKDHTIVRAFGRMVESPFKIKMCTIQDMEFILDKIEIVSEVVEEPKFVVNEMDHAFQTRCPTHNNYFSKKFGKNVIETELCDVLDNRWLSLRADRNRAIFTMRSFILKCVHDFMHKNNFCQIHTPKLIGVPSESGSEVFSFKYFGRKEPAFLAQSPQLFKQMAINGDLGRVYEVGPVFRAENSNTSRHLTEFIGIDLEMVFDNDYHQVVDMLYNLLVYILDQVHLKRMKEYRKITSEPFPQYFAKDKPLVVTFKQAIKLLKTIGKCTIPNDQVDLSTEHERKLGEIVKQEFGVDLFVLDKFPSAARPWYTARDPKNPKISFGYDIIFRGVEVLSGAQRVNDYKQLMSNIQDANINPEHLSFYLESFKYGSWPHAGGGFGLERLVKCLLGISNIREVCLFPRDPSRIVP